MLGNFRMASSELGYNPVSITREPDRQQQERETPVIIASKEAGCAGEGE